MTAQGLPSSGIELAVNKGAAGGYAPLDSGQRLPLANLTQAFANAIPDVVCAAATGTQATDAASLQAMLNNTPAGGTCHYRGAYSINAALNVPVAMTIQSGGWVNNAGPVAVNGPVNMTQVAGSKITQFAAATDIFQMFLAGVTINLRRLAIGFDASIAGNTGHGFNATPTATFTGKPDGGLSFFTWEDLLCVGHDGNHYAFIIVNPIGESQCTKLIGIGGGGLKIVSNTARTNYGNLVFSATYMDVFNAASSATSGGHGYELIAGAGRGATINGLGLMEFNRPQCNMTGAAAATGFQAAWTSSTGAAQPDMVKVNDPDFEIVGGSTWVGGSTVPGFIDFGGPGSGTIVEGGLLTNPPAAGFDTTHGYRKLTGSGTWQPPRSLVVGSPIRVRLTGAGGGGGGGGSASAVTNQAGGGGGGAGSTIDFEFIVDSLSGYTYATGAGGTSGAGAVANGAVGGAGGTGGTTQFNGTGFQARGGGGGVGGPNNSNGSAGGGLTGGSSTTVVGIPGSGGSSQSPNGNTAYIAAPGVVGGSGGGGASATLGGGGGNASTAIFAQSLGGGTGANQVGTAGAAGTTATTPGCGGGGGGAGAPTTGTGGAGGVGAAGQIEIWW